MQCMCTPSSGLQIVNKGEKVSVALGVGDLDYFPLEVNLKVFSKWN